MAETKLLDLNDIADKVAELALSKLLDRLALVKHGHWIVYTEDRTMLWAYKCSECGSDGHHEKWHYCPKCGAIMDEPTEE